MINILVFKCAQSLASGYPREKKACVIALLQVPDWNEGLSDPKTGRWHCLSDGHTIGADLRGQGHTGNHCGQLSRRAGVAVSVLRAGAEIR